MDGENLSNNECVICNTQYDTSTHIEFRLPCNHILCKSCMFELCKTSDRCPFCRMEFQVSIKQKDNSNHRISTDSIVVNNVIKEISFDKSIGILLSGVFILSIRSIF